MKCFEVEQWISVKVDGEPLPLQVTAQVEEHLLECAACRRVLAAEMRRAALLGACLDSGEAGRAALQSSIVEKAMVLGPAPAPPSPFQLRWGWTREGWRAARRAVELAAAVLLVALGLWWFLGPPPASIPEKNLPARRVRVIVDQENLRWVPGSDGTLEERWIRGRGETILDPDGLDPDGLEPRDAPASPPPPGQRPIRKFWLEETLQRPVNWQ